jgi:hypothetical protein
LDLRGEEVAVDWRRIHDKELYNLYVSANIITVINSRKVRWVGYVARMEERGNAYRILV